MKLDATRDGKTRPKMVKVTVRMPEELWQKAKRMAETRGISVSQLVRELIREEWSKEANSASASCR